MMEGRHDERLGKISLVETGRTVRPFYGMRQPLSLLLSDYVR